MAVKEIKLNELYEHKPLLALEKCREDFMLYTSLTVAAATYGIPYNTARSRAYYGDDAWKKQRDKLEDDAINAVISEKRSDLKKIVGLSSKLILEGLARYEMEEAPYSVDELAKISQVLSNVHKIWQLEQGNPTEIYNQEMLTVKDIREIINEINELDDFADYEELLGDADKNTQH